MTHPNIPFSPDAFPMTLFPLMHFREKLRLYDQSFKDKCRILSCQELGSEANGAGSE